MQSQLTRQKFSFETAKVEIITNSVGILVIFGFEETSSVEISRISGSAEYVTEDLGGVELEMVYIPAGSCLMGSNEYDEEKPIHQVNLSAFYMSKYPITQEQYQAIMGTNPAYFKGDKRPVESVLWDNAMEFCRKLSQLTGNTYSLPSESQWEYACRAGTTTPFYFGETITADVVNYNGHCPYGNAPQGEYREQTTSVGDFPPNGFGLYDMHGNVQEWCLDIHHENYHGAPTDGSSRDGDLYDAHVLRGGSWDDLAAFCRSSSRDCCSHDDCDKDCGFRVVCIPSTEVL